MYPQFVLCSILKYMFLLYNFAGWIIVHVKYPLTLCLPIYTDVQTAFVYSLLRAKAVNVGHEGAASIHFVTFVYTSD